MRASKTCSELAPARATLIDDEQVAPWSSDLTCDKHIICSFELDRHLLGRLYHAFELGKITVPILWQGHPSNIHRNLVHNLLIVSTFICLIAKLRELNIQIRIDFIETFVLRLSFQKMNNDIKKLALFFVRR